MPLLMSAFYPESEHRTAVTACPLWVKSRHLRAKRHVRFTPKSGHVRCNWGCPLWAKSGHQIFSICSWQLPDFDRTSSFEMRVSSQQRFRVVQIICIDAYVSSQMRCER